MLVPPRRVRREIYYRLLDRLGVFRRMRSVDLTSCDRIVFVCLGNICRSPFAQVYANSLGLNAVSFGLSAQAGRLADPMAVAIAESKGVSLYSHRTQKFDVELLKTNDLIVLMDPSHAGQVVHMKSQVPIRITLLGLWSNPSSPYIFDPYGTTEFEFDRCFELIKKSVDGLSHAVRGLVPLQTGVSDVG